jgi:hypothetical protein
MRTGKNVFTGRVVQREKRVLIHGAGMLRPAHLAE